MSQTPHIEDDGVDDPVEASHLEVEPYDDSERQPAPSWYDDTINVGDVANAEAPQ